MLLLPFSNEHILKMLENILIDVLRKKLKIIKFDIFFGFMARSEFFCLTRRKSFIFLNQTFLNYVDLFCFLLLFHN